MQSETGFPSRPSHQLKSYVASKSRLKLAARAVLSADAGLLVCNQLTNCWNLINLCKLGASRFHSQQASLETDLNIFM